MIVFQEEPDPIFIALVHEALQFVRDVHLLCYRDRYRPTRGERRELDESYGDLFPELARLFSRPQLVRLIEWLLRASRDEQRWYRFTDYHWLVLYSCLRTYCDLHNDEGTGTEDRVGPYEIEKIDFNAVIDRFFFDTDFLMGPLLLQAEEQAPGQLHSTREAWRIAAGLKPEAKDLRGEPMSAVRPVLWRSLGTVAPQWAAEPWRYEDVIGVTVEVFGDWFAVSLTSASASVLGDLMAWLPAGAQDVACIAERIGTVRAAPVP